MQPGLFFNGPGSFKSGALAGGILAGGILAGGRLTGRTLRVENPLLLLSFPSPAGRTLAGGTLQAAICPRPFD